MVPDDPLGRSGPRLEDFLRKDVFLRYLLFHIVLYLQMCFSSLCFSVGGASERLKTTLLSVYYP